MRCDILPSGFTTTVDTDVVVKVFVIVARMVEVETTAGSVIVENKVAVDRIVWNCVCVKMPSRCSVTVTVGSTEGSCSRQRIAVCSEMPVCRC